MILSPFLKEKYRRICIATERGCYKKKATIEKGRYRRRAIAEEGCCKRKTSVEKVR